MFTWQHKFFLIIVDLIFIPASIYIGFLIRFFEEEDNLFYILKWITPPELLKIIGFSLLCILTLYIFGLYGKVWRYAGVTELLSIFNAVTLVYIIIGLPAFFSGGSFFPRSVTVISWLLSLMLIGGTRMLLKWVSLRRRPRRMGPLQNLLIVGTGDEAEGYVRELLRQKDLQYWPVGFIDTDNSKKNVKIHNVPVLGTIDELPDLVVKHDIKQITIALPVISGQLVNKFLAMGRRIDVNVSIIPSVSEILDGKVTMNQTREIRVEDLLGREPVEFNNPLIAEFIKGQRVLVTGGGGSIGRELCRQIIGFEPEFLGVLGHGENSIHETWLELSSRIGKIEFKQIIADIRHKEKIDKIFEKFRFTVVFHAAAHKHVHLMEENPDEALANNVLGTRNLVSSADKYGVNHFVMVSTDKAVSPTGVMGASKKIAEYVVRTYALTSKTKFIIVRFGNVLGSRGSVVQTFQRQINRGGPVTVTHPDMTRYFMTAPEAVLLILEAASMGQGGEIFVLDMGRPVNIVNLAKNLIELSGYDSERDIPIVITGLRPGEKLTESLYEEDEEQIKTDHPKIFAAIARGIDRDKILQDVDKIENLLSSMDYDNLLKIFKEVIPTVRFDMKE